MSEEKKRSFLSEEEKKRLLAKAEGKETVTEIPPIEITMMVVATKVSKMEEHMGKLVELFSKAGTTAEVSTPVSEVPSTPTPLAPRAPSTKILDIRKALGPFIELLNIDEGKESAQYIKVSPKQFLGTQNFAKIAQTVKQLGGTYVSAGKASHFLIPKA